ncbi:MAG: TatD family hydrolase [Chloroflexi bacterium]|nr:TatD family hydrolase [Chloroflexota bacterium]
MTYLIDTHAHLNDIKFASDLPEVIAHAREAGVGGIIVVGYDLASSRDAIEIASRFDCVYATVGVHPHDAKSYDASTPGALAELSRNEKVVAIGEIGLDFHYDFSPRPAQLAVLEDQVRLAGLLGLPIVVHSRESNPQVLQVLRQQSENIHGCVFHYFSGDEEFAREVLDMGFYIGIDGPITYKASEVKRRVVEMCPLDRLLIETDCPYLAPIPYRGKRNEPAYARIVAEEAARIKGISLEELAEATTRNACALFGAKLQGKE